MRRSLLPFLSLLLHAYVAVRLLPPLASWPAAAAPSAAGPAVAALLLAALALSTWYMPMGLGPGSRRIAASGRRAWIGWLGMGLFSSLLVLTGLRDLVLVSARVTEMLQPGAVPWEALSRWSALAVALLAAADTARGFANARRTARVVRVDVPIRSLPAALEGFRIAQLSDIHVGPTIRGGYLARIVGAVNRLDADMVAITGDLVDGSVPELATHVAPLAGLSSRHGSFFVTGNHEYYAGAHAWIAELRRLGVRVLLDSHVVLRHGPDGDAEGDGGRAARLVVAGVADFGAAHFDPAHRSDPHRALEGAPADAGLRLLLAHQPRSAPAAADAGFDLQLSGHTHGGQFLPWNLFVPLQQPFVAGLHRLRGMWVYVSRGTGYWGPPKRFGAPSEITLLRLVRG
ncbi:MAG: metallophosphoesterase [Xylophilus ampelinus]